jgi:release factor glutamine methyltransferase
MENQTTPANKAMPRRVSEVLLTGARRLLAAGIESGRLDAELLLGHVLGMRREQLVIGASLPLSQEQWHSYESILLRRLDAEPTAYITGRQEFWSKDFCVTPDVLIPRPETECLVEVALKLAADWHEPLRILDLGTGSGAIAIALAGELPKAEIFATDISHAALMVARQNAAMHGVAGQIHFLQGDLFEAIRKVGAKFHLILSNPPYIRRGEIAELAPTVSRWEPRGALDGGPDGLDYYRRLAAAALEYLLPNGAVIVEIGADRGVSVRALFANAAACVDATIDQDYSGQDRIVVARHLALLEN